MGVTGGLVRSIFFRNKSFGAHDYNNNNAGRSNLGEKKRWSSVRSYLCGDEFNSVLAVDDSGSTKDSLDPLLITMSQQLSSEPCDSVLAIQDSASVKKHLEEEDSVSGKSSEVSVTQPLQKEEQSEATETHIPKKHPISKLFLEEDAAIIIQSAFRSYLAKRRSKEEEETFDKQKSFSGEESQGKVSMGTSLDVQTCSSVKAPFFRRRTLHKNNNTQVLRIKEEWDDSTVSSTISKSRIQSRIEAMTKRERALAYAFSQQLRICSKKKQVERNSEDESNIGWSWLERWMATRVPDQFDATTNIQAMKSQRLVRRNRSFSIAGELESCASNDIPLQFESISEGLQREKSISKRKSIPSNKTQRRHNKLQATKKDMQQQTKKAKKAKTAPTSFKMGNEHEGQINSSS